MKLQLTSFPLALEAYLETHYQVNRGFKSSSSFLYNFLVASITSWISSFIHMWFTLLDTNYFKGLDTVKVVTFIHILVKDYVSILGNCDLGMARVCLPPPPPTPPPPPPPPPKKKKTFSYKQSTN